MLEDRWILSRLATTARTINNQLGEYLFDAATRALRASPGTNSATGMSRCSNPGLRDPDRRPAAQRLLVGVLETLLRLLSPFTPFLCEELWQRLGENGAAARLLDPDRRRRPA